MHLPQYTYGCSDGIALPHLMQWHILRTVTVVDGLRTTAGSPSPLGLRASSIIADLKSLPLPSRSRIGLYRSPTSHLPCSFLHISIRRKAW